MKAIRQILKPVNHQITIQLPEEFNDDKEVEIIVLPAESVVVNDKRKSRKELFGKYKGQIWMSPDFDEPLEDFKEYME